ncbi:MAG: helix-turn-helix domain-containing protein [Lachnospiraceae bacterium]|nr:helix-turn-helix domain-containing protein [Lachnospiraceae bacterium]
MSDLYNSIMAGLTEAIEDAKGKTSLKRRTVTVIPVKNYDASEVKAIREVTGMTQKAFANYMGVSDKTIEAWEAGRNTPSGTASRLLNMIEMDHNIVNEFPFVKIGK